MTSAMRASPMMQLRRALAAYRVMATAASDGGGRHIRGGDGPRGVRRPVALRRAAEIQAGAGHEVRRLAVEASGLDPRRPVTAPVAVHVGRSLVVVSPHPDDPARDVMVVVDPLFIVVLDD